MINPILFPLYGSFAIHWYGVMVAIGVLIAIHLSEREMLQKKLLSSALYHELLFLCIITGIFGGKLVYILSEESWSLYSFMAFFQGGFSILGTITAIMCTLLFVLYKRNKEILPILDIIACYAPLIQAFGRVGCFLAGCCHGTATMSSFAVTYTHQLSLAPLGIPLCPTQLYSAFILGGICVFLWSLKKVIRTKGLLSCAYILSISAERFTMDFFRDDRIWTSYSSFLSFHQLFALLLGGSALVLLLFLLYRK